MELMKVGQRKVERALAMLSGILYIVCLATPAYHPAISHAEAGVYYGWAAILLGPIGLFAGHFSWLANPLLWSSWIALQMDHFYSAFTTAVVALAVALTFLAGKTIAVGDAGEFPYEVRFGYYLWLASIALAGAVAAIHIVQRDVEKAEAVATRK
ncbi:hypothetical protein [Ralstonia wenshanensis]|uniref:hypothetical protein n=1 Tax=Ralstonia wenshanensis TaxID=2842456 RepID=UPI0021B48C82|nr:hypothetical protein [Ralstonia wenshanensis]MCT7307917.1 hypothetical protein [Ralstonia wenshanensis]